MSSSTVTYTSVYTDSEPERVFWGADEELSDGGPPRVIVYVYDGLPMQLVPPPSLDYVPGPEHPPSSDYVPGLEHPHSPVGIPYVPETEYPEYLVPSDDEEPMEDQPLPVDASPTRLRRARKTVRLEPPMSASMNSRIAEHVVAPTPPLPVSSPPLPLPSPAVDSPTYDKVSLGYYHLLPIGLMFPRLRCHLGRELALLPPISDSRSGRVQQLVLEDSQGLL
ncbi:hypothetical protein Tco_1077159 [Tanacetum coccineum]